MILSTKKNSVYEVEKKILKKVKIFFVKKKLKIKNYLVLFSIFNKVLISIIYYKNV